MTANRINALGQSSLATQWARHGHSFIRYGIGDARSPFHDDVATTLDAASAAGIYVLVNLGVDTLAHARLGIPDEKTGKVAK